MARTTFEVFSEGIDEALQGIGSDPYSGMNALGLRVPTLATPDLKSRYLFLCCGFELPENARACITGIRTFATLGVRNTAGASPVVIEQEIVTPGYSLPDGNVSWHLRRIPLAIDITRGVSDLDSFRHRICKSPACLYETAELADSFYVHLTAYTPPNLGRPPGDSVGRLGTFHDLRFPWRLGWHNPEIHVEGPGYYALFASVRQSAGAFTGLAPDAGATAVTPSLGAENNFAIGYGGKGATSTGVLIWRVAGALRVEVEEC